MQYGYTALFTVELLIRIWADGCRGLFCGEDWAWASLDLFIVTTSLWEVAVVARNDGQMAKNRWMVV